MPDGNRRMVYSTDDGDLTTPAPRKRSSERRAAPAKTPSLPLKSPNKNVYVERDRKGRGGKTVTVVTNLQLPDAQLEALLKKLKAHCGAGGTLKEGALEIQGDHRDKVMLYLQKEGFTTKQKGG